MCYLRPAALGLALLLFLVLGVPSLAGTQTASPTAPSPVPASGDFAGLVAIGGGRRLYLECAGTGSPTVILEAGYRSPVNVWTDDLIQPDDPRTMVLQGVAAFTRVCAYERPGAAGVLRGALQPSRSDPIPMPRTAESVVADLHALLQAAGVPGPYVLVGHSLGGLFVRLYAATYPDEVAGLVLVDAWSEALQDLLTPEQWHSYVRFNSVVPPELAGYHNYETLDFAAASATMREAAAARPLGPVPLVVLAHAQPFGVPADGLGFPPEALERAWRAAQERLARLAPGARFVVATESAHYVQLQQPDLVISAVRQVVAAVRDPASWATPAASPPTATPSGSWSVPRQVPGRGPASVAHARRHRPEGTRAAAKQLAIATPPMRLDRPKGRVKPRAASTPLPAAASTSGRGG